MPLFRSIVFAAALAGLLAGLLLTVAAASRHRAADREGRGLRAAPSRRPLPAADRRPGTITQRRPAAWAPQDGFERTGVHARRQHHHRRGVRAAAGRRLRAARARDRLAPGAAVGHRRVCRVHAGAVAGPAARAARHARGPTRPAPALVARSRPLRPPPAWRCWRFAARPSGRWWRSRCWWHRIWSARRSRSRSDDPGARRLWRTVSSSP